MQPRVDNVSWCGVEAVHLAHEHLEATLVPQWGGNLISLRERTRGIDVLNTPRDAAQFHEEPVLFGMPVLFPPNRIADGEFTFGGRTYHFPITEPDRNNHEHGFLYNRPWKLISTNADSKEAAVSMAFDSRLHTDVLSYFPHPFQIQLDYVLRGKALVQRITIRNEGADPMPCGLGFHTTFRLPFGSADTMRRCRVALSVEKEWRLDERMLPTGDLEVSDDIANWRNGRAVFDMPFDNAYLARVSVQHSDSTGQVAVLTDEASGLKVTYCCSPDYKHWVVYNADGRQGYISIEPYTWITNTPNLALPAQVTGFRSLAPSESWSLESTIAVETI